jgi:hypothetical protein
LPDHERVCLVHVTRQTPRPKVQNARRTYTLRPPSEGRRTRQPVRSETTEPRYSRTHPPPYCRARRHPRTPVKLSPLATQHPRTSTHTRRYPNDERASSLGLWAVALTAVVVAIAIARTQPASGHNKYEVWAIDQSDSPARPTAERCTSGTATISRSGGGCATRITKRPRNMT